MAELVQFLLAAAALRAVTQATGHTSGGWGQDFRKGPEREPEQRAAPLPGKVRAGWGHRRKGQDPFAKNLATAHLKVLCSAGKVTAWGLHVWN